jgi:Ca2+-binding EF-hand superfamily protein
MEPQQETPQGHRQGQRPTSTPASYQRFSFRERGQFEDAFHRMSLPLHLFAQPQPSAIGSNTQSKQQQQQQNANAPSAATNDSSFECAVITAEHLPYMTRLLNLSFSEAEIGAVAKRFGKSCETLQRKIASLRASKATKTAQNSARSAASEASAPENPVGATSGAQSSGSTASPLSDSTELLFDFETVVEIYNAYAPIQRDFETQYMQFFNLLDSDEQDLISVSDLRHALCNLGDALTDREFNHLLYANKLLHRTSISIFEFMSLLMGSVE